MKQAALAGGTERCIAGQIGQHTPLHGVRHASAAKGCGPGRPTERAGNARRIKPHLAWTTRSRLALGGCVNGVVRGKPTVLEKGPVVEKGPDLHPFLTWSTFSCMEAAGIWGESGTARGRERAARGPRGSL